MRDRSLNSVLISVLLWFLFALSLSALSFRYPELGRSGATLMTYITAPVEKVLSSGKNYFKDIFQEYIALRSVRKDNQLLLTRVERLEMLNINLTEEREENKRLRKLLNLAESKGIAGSVARIIGFSPTEWKQTITIDKGNADGVYVGMSVVDGIGVVGQIVTASASSSDVMLITDHNSSADVIVQSSRARGIVEGRGKDTCLLKFVSRNDEVRVGDRIITSGLDGVYPRGLLVGTVTRADRKQRGMFQTIEIKPAAALDTAEEVTVVQTVSSKTAEDSTFPWCSMER